jgi:hypothetical protein
MEVAAAAAGRGGGMGELTGNEPDLKLGDSDYEWVVELQLRMYTLGYYPDIPDGTGTFDYVTENAVRQLQWDLGHDNDGMVTRQTWEGILYLERQNTINYQALSSRDALDQLRFDQSMGIRRDGQGNQIYPLYGDLSEDGQLQWDGYGWQPAPEQHYEGEYSPDGQHWWDGYSWQAVPAAEHEYIGQLSDDGQYRWDGYTWQPVAEAGGQHHDYVGQLSDDGRWRWDGSQWQAA